MANVKFFGFYTMTNVQGRVSVQVVSGSRCVGFATEATARAKLNKHVERRAEFDPRNLVVCAFNSQNEAYKYLREVNGH